MNILVLGASGQVATELAALGAARQLDVACMGHAQCDLSVLGAVASVIAACAPDLVINAAAYTAVDKAEAEEDVAARLNAAMVEEAARACAARDTPFVHYSTDYVFDGQKPAPYVETDPLAPLGAYGRTKAAGEAAVMASGARAAIVRTSWVYSAHGANFLKTMLRLARDRSEISVVADQQGGPTWARDAAAAGLALGLALTNREARAAGVFHFSSANHTDWAAFAAAIFEIVKSRGLQGAAVKPITTAEYPTPTRRPMNSRLDCSKIAATGLIQLRPWRESLEACLAEMLA